MRRDVLILQRLYQRLLIITGTSHLGIPCLMLLELMDQVTPSHGCETVASRFVASLPKMLEITDPF